jgi:drug/metabolite transporter (DMT)-like permease
VTRRGWVLFVAMCIIWGLPYLLIRVAVRDLSPAAVVFARTALGALVLLPVAFYKGVLPDLKGHWRWLLFFTVVELAVPWFLLTDAEEHLTSSLAGLLVAAVPLVGVVLARLVGQAEQMTGHRWAGLLIGIAGVGSLVGLQVGTIDMTSVLEIFVVAVGYATGPLILSTRLAGVPSLAVVSTSLTLTAIVYAPFAVASHPQHVHAKIVWSVIGLAVVCTAVAFLVFFALIAEVGPTRSTVITYVNPAVAIALGVTVLSEHLTKGMVIGFPLVLIGSVLATSRSEETASTDDVPMLGEEPVVSPG